MKSSNPEVQIFTEGACTMLDAYLEIKNSLDDNPLAPPYNKEQIIADTMTKRADELHNKEGVRAKDLNLFLSAFYPPTDY